MGKGEQGLSLIFFCLFRMVVRNAASVSRKGAHPGGLSPCPVTSLYLERLPEECTELSPGVAPQRRVLLHIWFHILARMSVGHGMYHCWSSGYSEERELLDHLK